MMSSFSVHTNRTQTNSDTFHVVTFKRDVRSPTWKRGSIDHHRDTRDCGAAKSLSANNGYGEGTTNQSEYLVVDAKTHHKHD